MLKKELKKVLITYYQGAKDMKKIFIMSCIVMLSAFIYVGCSQKDNPVSSAGTGGILKIQMIDSPADYSEVNIVIDSVQAHISTSDSTSGWFTLNNKPAAYNLLKLVNGVNAVLGEDTLQPGSYSQIRLYLGSGSNVVLDGQKFSLTTPSASHSGVKLNVDATVQAGIAYVLTLDFDAARSIVITGSPFNTKYILKPVIRVAATATTGIIAGTVSPDSVAATVWAIAGSDSISTSTDANGGFRLQYLNPDNYKVYIAPKDTAYSDTTITNVGVTASNTNDLGTIVLTHE